MLRRKALRLWQQKLGSDATYNKLIGAFNRAGYKQYADNVKKIVQYHNHDDSDSSCSEDSFQSVTQPETFPNPKPSSVELPSEVSCETYTRLDSKGWSE